MQVGNVVERAPRRVPAPLERRSTAFPSAVQPSAERGGVTEAYGRPRAVQATEAASPAVVPEVAQTPVAAPADSAAMIDPYEHTALLALAVASHPPGANSAERMQEYIRRSLRFARARVASHRQEGLRHLLAAASSLSGEAAAQFVTNAAAEHHEPLSADDEHPPIVSLAEFLVRLALHDASPSCRRMAADLLIRLLPQRNDAFFELKLVSVPGAAADSNVTTPNDCLRGSITTLAGALLVVGCPQRIARALVEWGLAAVEMEAHEADELEAGPWRVALCGVLAAMSTCVAGGAVLVAEAASFESLLRRLADTAVRRGPSCDAWPALTHLMGVVAAAAEWSEDVAIVWSSRVLSLSSVILQVAQTTHVALRLPRLVSAVVGFWRLAALAGALGAADQLAIVASVVLGPRWVELRGALAVVEALLLSAPAHRSDLEAFVIENLRPLESYLKSDDDVLKQATALNTLTAFTIARAPALVPASVLAVIDTYFAALRWASLLGTHACVSAAAVQLFDVTGQALASREKVVNDFLCTLMPLLDDDDDAGATASSPTSHHLSAARKDLLRHADGVLTFAAQVFRQPTAFVVRLADCIVAHHAGHFGGDDEAAGRRCQALLRLPSELFEAFMALIHGSEPLPVACGRDPALWPVAMVLACDDDDGAAFLCAVTWVTDVWVAAQPRGSDRVAEVAREVLWIATLTQWARGDEMPWPPATVRRLWVSVCSSPRGTPHGIALRRQRPPATAMGGASNHFAIVQRFSDRLPLFTITSTTAVPSLLLLLSTCEADAACAIVRALACTKRAVADFDRVVLRELAPLPVPFDQDALFFCQRAGWTAQLLEDLIDCALEKGSQGALRNFATWTFVLLHRNRHTNDESRDDPRRHRHRPSGGTISDFELNNLHLDCVDRFPCWAADVEACGNVATPNLVSLWTTPVSSASASCS